MTPENKIVVGEAVASLQKALLGKQMLQLYSELTQGVTRGANKSNGNFALNGDFNWEGFKGAGLVVHATVVGESATVAVLKLNPEKEPISRGGLLLHSERVVAVQTNYFDKDGHPLREDLVVEGSLDSCAHLVAMTSFRGSTRLSVEYDAFEKVTSRARRLLGDGVPSKLFFNID